jgi:hypothetical protein
MGPVLFSHECLPDPYYENHGEAPCKGEPHRDIEKGGQGVAPYAGMGGNELSCRADDSPRDIENVIFIVGPETVSCQVGGDQNCHYCRIVPPGEDYEEYDRPENDEITHEGAAG